MKRLEEDAHVALSGSAPRPLIVHVVRQFLPNRGGLEDVVHNLCLMALAQGFRIRVVTLNSLFSDPARVLKEREVIDGIEVVRIPWRGTSRYPVAPSVLTHIADADIVHVHAIDFFFDFLALTRLKHRKPMIVTTHGGFFHTKRFAAIKKVWFQTLTRFSAAQYRYVVGCSRSDTALFAKIAPKTVRMIENGSDTGKFAGAALGVTSKRIATIGRFSANKRLDRLIEAMAELVKRDPEWQLDILGVPSDLTVADLEQQIQGLSLQGKVRVQAGLSNEAVKAVLSQCSVFASASEYEGFGLVAIEAMSAGLLPVLEGNEAYRALGRKHKAMVLTDFSDAGRAAADIRKAHAGFIADHDRIQRQMRDEAEAYSWDRVARDYIALYREIAEAKG